MRISKGSISGRARLHYRLGAALAGFWLLLVQAGAFAASGGEAYSAPSQLVGQGVTVSVAKLMADEARRRANAPAATDELVPIKREFEFAVERRRGLSNTARSPAVSAYPNDAADDRAPVLDSPQTVGVSSLGVVSTEAGGFVPPDSHGAAGDTQFLVAANLFIRSFNKSTGAADGALAMSLSTFFAPVSGAAGLSDPRVKFDPISRRWFISIITTTTSTNNRVLLAISSGANITGTSSFTYFSFAATAGGGGETQTPFADYDTLGIDAKGVYIGVNMFNTAGTAFLGSTLFVLNKPALLSSTPTLNVTAFRQLNNGSGAGMSTPYVGDNSDPAATAAYAVGADNAAMGLLVIRRITGADTATPAISANFNVTVPATAAPVNVTVQGRSQAALDALDDRLFEAKVSGGRLWTAHNIQVDASGVASNTGGRTGSRWYEFGTLDTTPTLIQSGTLFSSAATNPDSYWIPSIGITGQGHAALASSVAGAARFPDIAYAGRLSGDTAGTLRAPTTAQTSPGSYNVSANRWGDYSHTATDPNDNMTLWTFQEYAPNTTSWGVRAIQLRAPPPAVISTMVPNSLAQGITANVTITGLATNGAGFYDPPANFPNHIAATLGAGVTVNAVTFNSPTSLTASITVDGGAALGARDLVITNPDGQTASGAGLFSVTGGSCSPVTIDQPSVPSGIVGVPYPTQTFTATPAASYTFTAVGTLPPALALSGAGVLAGTPSAAGTYNFSVIATDGTGCSGSRAYSITVGTVTLSLGSRQVTSGNNIIEPNECNTLTVGLSNIGNADAGNVTATLVSSTPGVTNAVANSAYPTILAGGPAVTNSTAFQISTDNTVACGSTVNQTVNVSYLGGTASFPFTLPVGQLASTNYVFTNSTAQTIPAGGTLLATSQADDLVITLPVPFAFSVYGTTVASGSSIRVSTNGHLRIEASGANGAALTNAPLPSSATGLPAALPSLMPYWDDLDMTTAVCSDCGIYTQVIGSAPNRQWVVEWRARHFVAAQALATRDTEFAVVFNEGSNQFRYIYGQTGAGVNAGGASATVGIQAATTGTTFTQFSFNSAALSPGLGLAAAIPAAVCTTGPGVCAGPPTQLAIGTQPSDTVAGASISPAVTVRILDAGGLQTSSNANVTLAFGANPGSGTLSGTATVAAVNGVATFSNLSIDKAGTGYTLAASSPGLTGATSNTFNIGAAAPAQLAFLQQPTNTASGAAISPAITVRALDSFGNLTGYTGNITLAISNNPVSGVLSGTITVAAVGGIATFSGLSIDIAGNGYTLAASSPGLTGATSSAFNIVAGAPTQLLFAQQPSNTVAGAAISPAMTVRILDAAGNQTPSNATVTLAIGANPSLGTLSGTTSVAAVNGIATFSNLSIDKAGMGYNLSATSPGLSSSQSILFDISAGAPALLSYLQNPTNTAGGAAISPAITVRALDNFGNLTGYTGNVTLAISNNPTGGTLSGTTTVAAVAGVATFSGLSINTAGNGYTLAASSGLLTGATSSAFNITVGAAAQLAFGQQPSNSTANAAITPAPTVRILDAGGNLTAATANVTVAIGNNPGPGTLGGTLTVAASAGVATFANLTINVPGNGYTLTAASAGLTGTTSNAFNVVCPPTVVTNGNDSGAGSLRQVIADACAGSTITFAGGVTSVGLTTAQLLINKNLIIDGGAGVTVTRVDGSPDFRIFGVAPGNTATLDSLTMTNGRANVGGVIRNEGNLTILDAVISGGIASASGGGVYNQNGVLQISNSTISGNTSASIGGAITNVGFSIAASATIIDSSVVDNRASFAAGIQNQGAALVLTNCTIANNEATGADPSGGSGGLDNVAANFNTTAALVNCTFNGNRQTSTGTPAADDLYSGNFGFQSTVTVKNTILGGSASTATANVITYSGGVITSQGNNLSSDAGAGVLTGPGDLINADPRLASAGNYGGTTQTLALLPGSPAINAGNNAGAPATDQRGIARPQQGTVDIGAFESRGFTLALSGGNNQSAGPGLAFATPLTATVTALGAGEPVQGGVVTFTPPGAGASASLAPNPATIGAGGVASSTATANATVGPYSVAAAANGATPSLSYALTNAGADLSIDDFTITEGNAGISNATFTVTRTNSLTAFSVPYSMTAGAAQAGSDYTATSGTLNFAVGGAPTQTITVPVVGDLTVEATETATLNLGAVTNTVGVTTVTDGSGLLTITDNDSATVQFAPVSVSQTEATSPMAFTVTLSAPVQSGVTLTVNSTPGSAGAADFTPIVGGTVTFAPNSSTSLTVNVVVNNDALDENDENFSLGLSGLSAVGNVSLGAATAVGTIVDDDPLPTLSISSPSQAEGNSGTSVMNFTVSLSAVSGRDVVFTRATADGSATTANNDYVPLAAASATIPAGQTSLTIPVTINGDGVYEGNETFTLNLSAISNATPTGLTGTGTIVDDDQQPTTTTINSDVPDPSLTGQPYTVNVTVAAQTASPLGTVTISDGSASCGPVTLTTGTSPNSSASCALTSTSAGAKTLTASYTPASTAFAASSGTAGHQVNAAATAISVVGPTRSQINQPTTFTFALSVNAPGGGSPAGTVTLSSGASTCNVTVPTATPSCALNFSALGSRTVNAAFAPGNTSYTASSSSGAGNAQTLVYALSDIVVTKTDAVGNYRPGDLIVYTVTVRNNGPDTAVGIRVRDDVPVGLSNVVWTCNASGGAVCAPTSGSGNLDVSVPGLISGALLNYTFFGNVSGSPAQIANTALVELPADTTVEDPNLGNNSATDTDVLDDLFKNGFESALVNAASGSYRMPSAALRTLLDETGVTVYRLDDADGEALRVYARVFDGQLQYALAGRDGNGALRLGGWRSYAGEPTLNWTARLQASGWVLENAELR